MVNFMMLILTIFLEVIVLLWLVFLRLFKTMFLFLFERELTPMIWSMIFVASSVAHQHIQFLEVVVLRMLRERWLFFFLLIFEHFNNLILVCNGLFNHLSKRILWMLVQELRGFDVKDLLIGELHVRIASQLTNLARAHSLLTNL
jgi:hypothetical protein